MSERDHGATGWSFSQGLFLAILLILSLSALSACGSEQTDTAQTGNNVPVSLSISMPQESAAASTRGNRFWAILQRWLPTITEAWAQQTPRPTSLTAIQVDVTGPDLAPISTTKDIPPNTASGSLFTIDLGVPVGRDRVFTVSGFVGTGNLRYQGKSSPTTLTAGQPAFVDVTLIDNTTGTVTGTVTNAGTGAPLSGATVAVTGTGLSTITNNTGDFTLNGLSQGSQTLTISRSGFNTATKAVMVVGASVSAGTIALTQIPTTGTVTGTVTNASTGTPLPNATVGGTGFSTTTDTNGNFTLNGILQGPQTLAISASGFTSTTHAVTVVAGASVSAGTIALTPLPTSKLAFSTDRDGNREVYVINTDRSAQTNLTNNPAFDSLPVWSPDTRKLAFASNRDGNAEVYVMNADGSAQTNLTNNPAFDSEPAWSPDGQKLAFETQRDDSNREIYVMNADGSAQVNLTNNPAFDADPAWSPDGTKIAFASDRDGDFEVYVMNADGSALTNLTNNPAFDGHPAWSPDGTKLAFESERDGNREIYVMNADGNAPTNLTNNEAFEGEPAWSPDGTKLAFASTRDGNFEIYVMNADGSTQTNVTNNPAFDSEPDWQPLFIPRPIGTAVGPLSSANPSGTCAEPVNTVTGSYFFRRTDLALPGRELPVIFSRTYRYLVRRFAGEGSLTSSGASLFRY